MNELVEGSPTACEGTAGFQTVIARYAVLGPSRSFAGLSVRTQDMPSMDRT